MAEKAKKVSFSPLLPMEGLTSLSIKGQSGIQDPYSGKYYGEVSYDQLVSTANAARSRITQQLSSAGNPLIGSKLDQPYSSDGFGAFRTGQNLPTLGEYLNSQLASIFIPKKENYVQFDKINQSYQAFGADWDNFFKGNYQNPRLTEEQANRQARGKQQFNQKVNQAQSVQAITEGTDMASSRKTMGTGVGTSSFNPFATLEAGLGL